MTEAGIIVSDHRIEFCESRDSLRVALAQISPAYDQDVFANDFLVRARDPERQAERIVKIIRHARSTDTDLLVFPELVAPFSHREAIETELEGGTSDFIVCIPYEHTTLGDVLPLLSDEERVLQGLPSVQDDTRLINFSRIFVRAGDSARVFSQIKLTPFSGEFSLSAKDTLLCGKVLHRLVTNWGSFVFLICKDYVGEVHTEPPVPMFDFLKNLTEDGLHYVLVSALNPEPEAFIHAARSFYYLQEKSSHTFSIFLNGAELDHTTVVFPARPHPRARGGENLKILPLFETKPGWGTQVRFPGSAERLIRATLARLDTYTNMPTKEIFSPVYEVATSDLAALGIEQVITGPTESEPSGSGTAEVPVAIRHNLPCFPTPFVGRDAELSRLMELLDDPAARLVTLVGPGGAGKSRLAHQAASQRLERFCHGVYFVSLAPVASADFIPATLADSMSFPLHGREDPRQQLLNYLREKRTLLFMDSFEHLLEGAGFVGEILQAAALVKVLATSRERLNLMGEWTLEVGGLPVPDRAEADDAEQYGGVRLFIECAQRIRPDFALAADDREAVVRICQLVDGMPLAIELASSWVRALSCGDILDEMEHSLDLLDTPRRDAPERHKSLRAVFDHSWALLTRQEREALMRLSVFRGGFRREAASAVGGASLPLISALVDKSLLRWDPAGRYQMHQLLRDYVEEQLEQAPGIGEEAHERHCRYFADFLHERRRHLRGPRDRDMADEIGQEIENVRRAWNWATEHSRREEIDRSLNSLHRFYWVKGLYCEGESALSGAAEALRAGGENSALGKALAGQGAFRRALSRYDDADRALRESLDIFRKEGRDKYAAFSLGNLGMVAAAQGRYGEAQQLYEESLALSERTNDLVEMAEAVNGLGTIANRQGRYQEAEAYFQRALSICRQTGDRKGAASALNNLGSVASLLNQKEKARELFEEALALKKEEGDAIGATTPLSNLGTIAGQVGDYEVAKRMFEEALAIRRETGSRAGVCNSLINLGVAVSNLGDLEQARMHFREALTIAAEIQAEPAALTALPFISELLSRTGEKEIAVEIAAMVSHHRASPEGTRQKAERVLATLRGGLPPSVFSVAEERGVGGDLWQLVSGLVSDSR
jgi:predicted ATPase/Tfp pilus assembly protein PilF